MTVIAFVSDAVYPWNVGGKEIRYHEVSHRLAKAGFDVDVYTMHWWDGPRSTSIGDVRYHAICRRWPLYAGRRRSIVQAVAFSFACLALLWRSFDVIEADHMPYLQLFSLRVVAWARRRPLIVTWHEMWGRESWRSYLGAGSGVAAALEQLAIHLPDHIVAASPETGRRLVDGGRRRSMTVVPNGIDSGAIDRARPADERTDVLYVGRLLSHKNVDVLLHAVARLHRSDNAVRCLIVGTGPERLGLEQLALSLNIESSVRFLDRAGEATDVYALMKAARVFVLPSVREGFGISVLEALACGAPVVTADHPDNHARLLVDHGVDGWVCAPEAAALAEAIESALVGPTPPMKDGWQDRLDWDRVVADITEIYAACSVGQSV